MCRELVESLLFQKEPIGRLPKQVGNTGLRSVKLTQFTPAFNEALALQAQSAFGFAKTPRVSTGGASPLVAHMAT